MTKWTKRDDTLNHTDGASVEMWQIESLLEGASEATVREATKKAGWTPSEINSFVKWVNNNGGFQYKEVTK